jgi:DNA-binding MurR/RpiR family transcriptional regulator
MSVAASIEGLAGLAPAERRVADFLVGGGPEALVLSAAAIAERTGTSDATVVRTAQALGYAGLGEWRRALAATQPEVALPERLRASIGDLEPATALQSVVENHTVALAAMADRISPARFDQALDVLSDRARLIWRGVGPSACLADYARLLCGRTGRRATAWTHTGTSFADELLELEPSDAVVVLAYGRLQRHVHALLDHAEAVGAPVVLLTDATNRRIEHRVAVVLESGRGLPDRFASHGTTLVLIEALVLGLSARDERRAETSLERLNQLRAEINGRRIDVDRT